MTFKINNMTLERLNLLVSSCVPCLSSFSTEIIIPAVFLPYLQSSCISGRSAVCICWCVYLLFLFNSYWPDLQYSYTVRHGWWPCRFKHNISQNTTTSQKTQQSAVVFSEMVLRLNLQGHHRFCFLITLLLRYIPRYSLQNNSTCFIVKYFKGR